MKDAHDILRGLITSARSSGSQMAQYSRLPGATAPVVVEMVNGVPAYFVGDEEVTASMAVEALEGK